MKIIKLISIVILFFCQLVLAQQSGSSKINPEYDSLLAKRIGADDYGMKKYVVAFLKSGPVKIEDTAKRAELQREHLKNIMRLAEAGTLILAGPFLDGQEIRGIYLFNVETVDEARALAETDPAVIAGTLVLELHPWYGSAALMEIPAIHKKLEKNKIID
jgi:uncharacterized protein YciI